MDCWTAFQTTRERRSTKRIASGELLVSVISAWEVGLLESKGRIELSIDCVAWVELAVSSFGIRLAQLTPMIAVESTRLPDNFHGDPADRILVATARLEDARLLTKDRKLLEYGLKNHIRVLAA
jgi:PIN domain nuclease of toxin-antitoxin system